MLQSRDTFKQRHREYSHHLFRNSLMKDHRKAAEVLRALANPDDPEWKPVRDLLMSDEQMAEYSAEMPASRRAALDNQWGYTGLIGSLSRSRDRLFANFMGLAYGYSLASHIQHADAVGTSIALERDFREPAARRDTLHAAHQVRLISDIFTALTIRLAVGYRYVDSDPAPITAALAEVNRLMEGFGPVYKDWMAVEYPSG
jgi:hypothetical protein